MEEPCIIHCVGAAARIQLDLSLASILAISCFFSNNIALELENCWTLS